MNILEAQLKVDKVNDDRILVFCPLINNHCRTDCECYKKADLIEDTNTSQFFTTGGYCRAHALRGNL